MLGEEAKPKFETLKDEGPWERERMLEEAANIWDKKNPGILIVIRGMEVDNGLAMQGTTKIHNIDRMAQFKTIARALEMDQQDALVFGLIATGNKKDEEHHQHNV